MTVKLLVTNLDGEVLDSAIVEIPDQHTKIAFRPLKGQTRMDEDCLMIGENQTTN